MEDIQENLELPANGGLIKTCRLCNNKFPTNGLANDVCQPCVKKLVDDTPINEVLPAEKEIVCIDCGRSAKRKRQMQTKRSVAKFFVDGRCLPCHKKLLRMQREDSLLSMLKDEVVLTDDEKNTIKQKNHDMNLPPHVIEEIIIRLAAGQYVYDVCDSLNSQYNLKFDTKRGNELQHISQHPAFRPILQRLRKILNSKETCELVPITNKFQLALRLEGLYQEAEQSGSIRDRVLILKAAGEILAADDNKAPQQNNFLTIIQRIEASNRAQRAIEANFGELPMSALRQTVETNGVRERIVANSGLGG